MIKTLVKSLQIDICYAVNSFIYLLTKLPILKDLLTDDIYKSKILKKIIGTIGITLSLLRALFFKGLYFYFIYLIASISESKHLETFFHIYFFLTILGMFINNRVLSTSTKKYFSIILFNMDANKFLKSTIVWNSFTNALANTLFIYIFTSSLTTNALYPTIILVMITLTVRYIGEALNILFYRKYKYLWYSNGKIYAPIVLTLIALCMTPIINVYITFKFIEFATLISIILGIIALIYLFTIKDYKLLYKKVSSMTDAMNEKNQDDYLKQSMVELKDKDKNIDKSILENKSGYDLFNTIFFKRHKEILLRSARKFTLVSAIIYAVIIFIMLKYSNYNKSIAEFLHLRLAVFIIIMFFCNRGQVITQAMFFNCDHAMLTYNFYREPSTILELFKKRLTTVVKVNMIPAIVIGLGNVIILLISTNTYSTLTIISTFIFIISLSIFFSVHYLVIYYLLQPYNKEMKMRKTSYSVITLITYIITYRLSDLVISSEILSVAGILFVISYVIISLLLVYKASPRTFKLSK